MFNTLPTMLIIRLKAIETLKFEVKHQIFSRANFFSDGAKKEK